MTSPVLPAAIDGIGSLKVLWVPTIADTSAPTVAELNAAGAFDATPYLTGDGWAPSVNESTVTDERLSSRQVFEGLGTVTDSLQTKYVYRSQDPTAADNKAFATWKRGTTGFFVERWCTAEEVDIAANDIVDITPVVCDTQQKQPIATNEKLKIMQNMRVTGTKQYDVTVVA